MVNGSLIGFFGTILGTIVGVGFTMNIEQIKNALEQVTGFTIFDAAVYFLEHLPAQIIVADIILVVGCSLILCFLATIYPAYKASKMQPVEIIRYE